MEVLSNMNLGTWDIPNKSTVECPLEVSVDPRRQ